MSPKTPLSAIDSDQLAFVDILKQAVLIPFKDRKLTLPVLALSVLSSSLLSMGGTNYVSVYPRLLSFIIKLRLLDKEDPSTPQFYDTVIGMKADAEDFSRVYWLFAIVPYLVSLFSTLLVVLASAMACSAKESTLHDLLVRIQGSWKGLLVTKVYFTLLCIGYTLLSVSLIAILILNSEGSTAWIAMAVLIGISARLLYVYLSMVWMMGLVISVLEEGSYGLGALSKAEEIVKGRRRQGLAIAIILQVLDAILAGGYGIGVNKAQSSQVGLIEMNAVLLLKLFSMVVYTVFYFECKKCHRSGLEFAGDFRFTRTAPSVDETQP